MPPLYPRDLTLGEVDSLLRESEGSTSVHHPRGAGHANAKHHALTKTDLWNRLHTEHRNGEIALFTAFISRADMVAALQETLDSVEGKWARLEFHQAAPTTKYPKGSHNGMFAKIYYVGRSRVVRYAGGAGAMPVTDYVLLLYRDDSRRLGLHVKTFYGTTTEVRPDPRVFVYGRDRGEFSKGP
jgi:hypothetical protein